MTSFCTCQQLGQGHNVIFSVVNPALYNGEHMQTVYHSLLSFEWNSIRLGGPAHEIVTKTVHKTLPVGGGDMEWLGGSGVVGVKGVVRSRGGRVWGGGQGGGEGLGWVNGW